MIALVSPAYDAMARKAALSAWRLGRPNEVLEAPSVMFRPNSSRMRLIVSSVMTTACGSAPTVIASGSMTMSSIGISHCPWTMSTNRRQTSRRSSAVCGMPVSSFVRQMIAAPCSFTSGSTRSSRSSSQVTELTSALPS